MPDDGGDAEDTGIGVTGKEEHVDKQLLREELKRKHQRMSHYRLDNS